MVTASLKPGDPKKNWSHKEHEAHKESAKRLISGQFEKAAAPAAARPLRALCVLCANRCGLRARRGGGGFDESKAWLASSSDRRLGSHKDTKTQRHKDSAKRLISGPVRKGRKAGTRPGVFVSSCLCANRCGLRQRRDARGYAQTVRLSSCPPEPRPTRSKPKAIRKRPPAAALSRARRRSPWPRWR